MDEDSDRGTGRTSRQMRDAPHGAVFVWLNHHLNYPRSLARDLGRGDLQIVAPDWLTERKWIGRELSGLILDHAMNLRDPEQFENYRMAKTRVRGTHAQRV